MRIMKRRLTWQALMHSGQLLANTTATPPVLQEAAAPAELLSANLRSGHWLLGKLPRLQSAAS